MTFQVAMQHIVFIDEMKVEFNSTGKMFNLSRKGGVDPIEWAIHNKKTTTIRIMFLGAIYRDNKRP